MVDMAELEGKLEGMVLTLHGTTFMVEPAAVQVAPLN